MNVTNKLKRICGDLLYPARCPICDEPVPTVCGSGGVCPECRRHIRTVGDRYCVKCGKELHGEQILHCYDCESHAHFFTSGRTLFRYEDVRESLYRFKYEGRREYVSFYADEIRKELGETIRLWHGEAFVPVPMHAGKQKKRGYNQAALLAEALSSVFGIPAREDLIVRTVNTTPQKSLDRGQRQKNLKKAFKIVRNDVKLDTIIIVDDIYTTGSTVDAMARLFLSVGVKEIYFIALASGNGI